MRNDQLSLLAVLVMPLVAIGCSAPTSPIGTHDGAAVPDAQGPDGAPTSSCGDGVVEPAVEACDDGNAQAQDGCSPACLVEPGWQCEGSPSACACKDRWSGVRCDRCVVFVRGSAGMPPPEPRDGRSWASAVATLQEGIDLAHGAGAGCEVWVAAGTYMVFQGQVTDTITLQPGIALYGGFAGDESTREARSWVANPTILDGSDPALPARRVYHVVTALGADDAVLDGFTIRGGLANGSGGAEHGGGLLVAYSDLLLANLLVTENHAINGGGLYVLEADPNITGCRFENNTARVGAGASLESASPTIDDCEFIGNVAENYGGGLEALNESSPLLRRCRFESNHATIVAGGGLSFGGGGAQDVRSVEDCSFLGNTAGWEGGAISAECAVTIRRAEFVGNTAVHGGGAVFLSLSSWAQEIEDATFVGNTASNGGGVQLRHANARLARVTFLENSADAQGGGLQLSDGTLTLERARFEANHAEEGAGLYAEDYSSGSTALTVKNALFTGNVATLRGGGVSLVGSSMSAGLSATLVHVTLTGNEATIGGGMHSERTNPAIHNSIIWGNVPDSLVEAGIGAYCVVGASVIEGGYPGDRVLDVDPGFVDPSTGSLTLRNGSPCIDAADGTWTTPADLLGQPRFDVPGVANGGTGPIPYADLGAFEWSP